MENRRDEVHGEWLCMDDAQRYAGGISRSTLQRLLRKKAVRGTRVGARTLVYRQSLDEYLMGHGYDSEVTPVRD